MPKSALQMPNPMKIKTTLYTIRVAPSSVLIPSSGETKDFPSTNNSLRCFPAEERKSVMNGKQSELIAQIKQLDQGKDFHIEIEEEKVASGELNESFKRILFEQNKLLLEHAIKEDNSDNSSNIADKMNAHQITTYYKNQGMPSHSDGNEKIMTLKNHSGTQKALNDHNQLAKRDFQIDKQKIADKSSSFIGGWKGLLATPKFKEPAHHPTVTSDFGSLFDQDNFTEKLSRSMSKNTKSQMSNYNGTGGLGTQGGGLQSSQDSKNASPKLNNHMSGGGQITYKENEQTPGFFGNTLAQRLLGTMKERNNIDLHKPSSRDLERVSKRSSIQ